MNQREPSGLPIRAIVMVLLFLGIAFALVGWNATRSSDGSDSSESSTVSTVTATSATSASTTAPPPAVKADVRVYNISEVAGAAEGVASKLREAQWNVTDVTNLALEGVTATTVFYGETPGEHDAADEVGKLLAAPVEQRVPGLAEQPPGVIVAVTG
jgi:hypothetical protein